MDYKNLKISEYMDSLASSAPAPGGGPVAALTCAEGAGLCIMVCELSIGKKKFEELLGGLIHKPPGKPALVPISDRRAEWNTAKNDFMED